MATGMVCPCGLDHGLARVRGRAQHVELAALTLVEDGHDAAADELIFAPGEQLAGRMVGHADHAVGRGHEHGVGHAAEHVREVVLVDRGLAQLLAHALERLLQLAEFVARPPTFEWPRIVALRDAVGALDQRGDRLVHALASPPGHYEARTAAPTPPSAPETISAFWICETSSLSKRERASGNRARARASDLDLDFTRRFAAWRCPAWSAPVARTGESRCAPCCRDVAGPSPGVQLVAGDVAHHDARAAWHRV
jgi:hypothetical protein